MLRPQVKINVGSAMKDDSIDSTDDSDTVQRPQGDRDTHTSDLRSRRVPPPFAPGQTCGDFEFVKQLGQGSSGYVYRVFDAVKRRHCALKVLTPRDAQDLRRNQIGFRRMMGLRHPNLMRVDQMYQLDEHVAMSMEEIQGETLAKTRRRYRTMPPHIAHNKILGLIRHYASALSAMHSRGLVHRDIKPSNLMVDRSDIGRVIDYGLVGTFDAEFNDRNYRDYLVGTMRFISPEALFDQRYTPSGDIFSLGLVMLEFLNAITGRNSWKRTDEDRNEDADYIHAAVDGLDVTVPQILREACSEMTQQNPGDRATAVQIARLGLPKTMAVFDVGNRTLMGRDDEFTEICKWLNEIYTGGSGRLHIHGASGIGKTAMLDAVEQHLISLGWGQSFRANCQPRENYSAQALDQFAVEIAARYSRNDREPLWVDSVTAGHLCQVFPVLKHVIRQDISIPGFVVSKDARETSLKSAIRLVEALKQMGPLILIIDDIQYADPDTGAIMDFIQANSKEMVGIITVSRKEKTLQNEPPTQSIKLQPLGDEESKKVLAEAAKRYSVSLSDEALDDLCQAASGNPFRLIELTNEFRPGGILHRSSDPSDSSLSNFASIDRLWEQRAERLSSSARCILPFIATAPRGVSITQLEGLTGLGEQVEIALSELVNQRLVTDDAESDECIHMIHDRISQGILSQLTPQERIAAHGDWAEHLKLHATEEKPDNARIARHLIDAEKPTQAIPFLQVAAEYAEEHFKINEAAQQHLLLCELVSKHKIPDVNTGFHRREAARCLVRAEQPIAAAETYLQLAEESNCDEERVVYKTNAAILFVRAGRFNTTQELVAEVCETLDLPTTKMDMSDEEAARASLRVVRRFIVSSIRHRTQLKIENVQATPRDQLRSHFCHSLIRPTMLFSGMHASQLFNQSFDLAKATGNSDELFALALGAATFACADRGKLRTHGNSTLRQLQTVIAESDNEKALGDYWAACAASQMFAMNWSRMSKYQQKSCDAYNSGVSSQRGSIGLIRWMELWSQWYRGDWQDMCETADDLVSDSMRRDDMTVFFLATNGLAGTAWLGRDQGERWQELKQHSQSHFGDAGDLAKWLSFIAKCQFDLYHGNFAAAHERYAAALDELNESELARVQIVRVVTRQLGALSSLHLLNQSNREKKLATQARRCINRLRKEQRPCTEMLADFYEATLHRIMGQLELSAQSFVSAMRLAGDDGLSVFQLIAEDNLAFLRTGEEAGLMSHRMRNQWIAKPDQFINLYTVPIDES